MATVGDIANAKKVTDRFVSRTMRLAYLAPDVLEPFLERAGLLTIGDKVNGPNEYTVGGRDASSGGLPWPNWQDIKSLLLFRRF
jgi:hypothetical protein